MTRLSYIYVGVAGLLTCVIVAPAYAAADLPSAQVRAKIIETGEQLLNPPEHKFDPAKGSIKSPFTAKLSVQEVKAPSKTGRPSSDLEFLKLLAAKLNPTGVLMMGDDALLLFGEKKVKVGDTIKIPFDKDSVDVDLVDLSGTSFTLRLNNEQLTRPIKPGKTP